MNGTIQRRFTRLLTAAQLSGPVVTRCKAYEYCLVYEIVIVPYSQFRDLTGA
jgi:hypothetical protein